MKAAFGTVENVRKVPSRQIVQVIIELPIESYVAAVTLLDGQKVLVTVSDLNMPFGVIDGSEPEVKKPEANEPKEKIGPLCSWAVMRCKEPEFQKFMRKMRSGVVGDLDDSEESAKFYICEMIAISSRKELDKNPKAALAFRAQIMAPWSRSLLNPHRETA